MMYECNSCGNLARMPGCETNVATRDCPVCDRPTTWRVAFEAEGVSY